MEFFLYFRDYFRFFGCIYLLFGAFLYFLGEKNSGPFLYFFGEFNKGRLKNAEPEKRKTDVREAVLEEGTGRSRGTRECFCD